MATKTATPAKKQPARKPKPLRIQAAGIQLGADRLAELFFVTFTSKDLGRHLKDRQIGVPKDKAEAARRLAGWATREGARVDLFLG